MEENVKILFDLFGDNLRLVGGAVRDYLLKKETNDYDFSCLLEPDKIKMLLEKKDIKYLTLGEKFGTITAIIDANKYEITSTRKDINSDGRYAKVKFIADFKVDSERRDFTFNALYMDKNGKIYDYHNGISDLEKGIIRFIGNAEERIKEDYLRILRYFRFLFNYGKFLPENYELINSNIQLCRKHKDRLKKISSDRRVSEILKILD